MKIDHASLVKFLFYNFSRNLVNLIKFAYSFLVDIISTYLRCLKKVFVYEQHLCKRNIVLFYSSEFAVKKKQRIRLSKIGLWKLKTINLNF